MINMVKYMLTLKKKSRKWLSKIGMLISQDVNISTNKQIERMQLGNSILTNKMNYMDDLFNSIFTVNLQENRIKGLLNKAVNDMVQIDDQKLEFEAILSKIGRQNKEPESDASQINQKLNENVNTYYYVCDKELCWKLIEGDKISDTKIMDIDYYSPKVITLPTSQGYEVYLLGGYQNSDSSKFMADCF